MYSLLLILFVGFLSSVHTQEGKDCVTDADCNNHQHCQFGYCHCDLGYLKNNQECFKIRKYGQECRFEAQCQDFRMVCEVRGKDSLRLCVCDKYHEWDASMQECVQVANISDIVRQLKEKSTWAQDIELQGKRVFFGLVVAGLSVVGVGLACTALCLVYGCCCRGKRPAPNDDTEKLRIQEVASMDSPEGTYVAIPTDLTGMNSAVTSSLPMFVPIS